MSELELCILCEDPTGRAGKAEDSLYLGSGGPYCDGCWDELPDLLRAKVASLEAEVERLRDVNESWHERVRLGNIDMEATTEDLDTARANLHRFGSHRPPCHSDHDGSPCSCGWLDTLAGLQ